MISISSVRQTKLTHIIGGADDLRHSLYERNGYLLHAYGLPTNCWGFKRLWLSKYNGLHITFLLFIPIYVTIEGSTSCPNGYHRTVRSTLHRCPSKLEEIHVYPDRQFYRWTLPPATLFLTDDLLLPELWRVGSWVKQLCQSKRAAMHRGRRPICTIGPVTNVWKMRTNTIAEMACDSSSFPFAAFTRQFCRNQSHMFLVGNTTIQKDHRAQKRSTQIDWLLAVNICLIVT